MTFLIPGIPILFIFVCMCMWYKVAEASKAYLVVTPKKKFVCASDDKVKGAEGKRWFVAWPQWFPFIGRSVRAIDLTIQELAFNQETYEKGQARYKVRSSTKFRVSDVLTAGETFDTWKDLFSQLTEVVKAAVRVVTIKFDVVETRASKSEIEAAITNEIEDDLGKWGLRLINFQLVDFMDTDASSIISDISQRREVEIQSRTRQENAEKRKEADVKEAAADEEAKKRQIMRDREVEIARETQKQQVADQEKETRTKEYAIKEVEIVRQAEIDKEQARVKAEELKQVAVIKAEEDRDAEKINMEKKKLEGEGDRKRAEEQAAGDAAPVREQGKAKGDAIRFEGLAEAEAKEALQTALNKFGDDAIRALVAQQIVTKDEAVGIALAKAFADAKMQVFVGGAAGQTGFDLGQLLSSIQPNNDKMLDSVYNRLARPMDLGGKETIIKE